MPEEKLDSVSRSVCARAVRIIQNRGWKKGNWEDPDTGEVCFTGALNLAAGYSASGTFGITLGDKIVQRSGVGKQATTWNDTKAQNQGDVIYLLERAAAGEW